MVVQTIHEAFSGKMIDNHFGIRAMVSANGAYMDFSGNKYAYFSGVTVEASDGRYLVVASENPDVKVGDIVECEDSNLFRTLAPRGRDFYYVGIRSWLTKSQSA